MIILNKPILYMQTDRTYRSQNYSANGEITTIGAEGCGICVSAMVIASLKDKAVTPITTANWSMKHGFKALHQGTYYGYFVPQLAEYGIECKMLGTKLWQKPTDEAYSEAKEAVMNGKWLIACMGPGRWTTSGHYILVYGYKDGYVYINDSYNTKPECLKTTWEEFAKEVKCLWSVNPEVAPNIEYKTHNGKKWLSKVINDTDYAGILGIPIRFIKISNVKNVGRIQYRVHFIEINKWSKWKIGSKIGVYAGNKNRTIDRIEIKILDSNDYKVMYRTSTIGYSKYNKWVDSTQGIDSGRKGEPIDRIQIKLAKYERN